MNWAGEKKGLGPDSHLLTIASALVVAIKGGGTVSLDHDLQTSSRLSRRRHAEAAPVVAGSACAAFLFECREAFREEKLASHKHR